VDTRTLREIIRHILVRSDMIWLVNKWRSVRHRPDTTHLSLTTLRDRFSYIYDNSIWQMGDETTPASGKGSRLDSTLTVRRELPKVLDSLGAKSILDLGCGDFSWMKEVKLRQLYIGADIVESVIRANNQRFSSLQYRFVTIDATKDTLPVADVVLCREMMFHLSFMDIARTWKNITASGGEYVMLTNDKATRFNSDIISGDYRVLNFHVRPFFLPAPLYSISDGAVFNGRSLDVWKISDLHQVFRVQ
jgi:SAM-dependent methyltransferase